MKGKRSEVYIIFFYWRLSLGGSNVEASKGRILKIVDDMDCGNGKEAKKGSGQKVPKTADEGKGVLGDDDYLWSGGEKGHGWGGDYIKPHRKDSCCCAEILLPYVEDAIVLALAQHRRPNIVRQSFSDVFNKFKDEKGEFRADSTKDVQGMLNLYEACYLSFNGEDIMDEALFFTTNHLASIVTRLSAPLASQVKHALETPLQKGFKRLESRNQISIYEKDESHNESLLTLAKLDYNMVQLIHKKEITEVKRWWQDLDLKSKVPFEIRDRVVEGQTPHMMYTQISRNFNHLLMPLQEVDAIRRGGFNGSPYVIKEMKGWIEVLMEEAKVIFSGDVPTLENWLPLSTTTAGINVFLTVAVLYMGELRVKEVYEWIDSMPKIFENAYTIVRLLDDIGTHKVEEHRGITLSSLTCYMKDHGVSQSEAIEKLHKMAASLWKDMNKECRRPNHVPMPLFTTVYNFTRIGVLFYENGVDNYTNPKGRMEEVVASVLINPIPI
ncbi:hypothetical protein IFM89_001459 [Coptis chinensis]|uniref:Uncharacterized protein n=1 Tax=Coptis chinensis TaxID=261450 RepID=A0A835GUP4_9MAGN|nr:hypothetical protein IFM89_001459 [Coptis chinensis]